MWIYAYLGLDHQSLCNHITSTLVLTFLLPQAIRTLDIEMRLYTNIGQREVQVSLVFTNHKQETSGSTCASHLHWDWLVGRSLFPWLGLTWWDGKLNKWVGAEHQRAESRDGSRGLSKPLGTTQVEAWWSEARW